METSTGNRLPLSSYLNLHQQKEASELIRSHDAAVAFYATYQDNRELYHDFVKGEHWDEEETRVLRDKKKSAIYFNKFTGSRRTFVGNLIQQRYDIKPAPMDPGDQNAADALSTLYHWTAHACQVRMKDPQIILEAWIGGNAWQESMVEVAPGQRPVIRVFNMNPFSVYPDPNSRDLVERKDCRFIDRVLWLDLYELCNQFPEHAAKMRAILEDQGQSSYQFDPDKKYADRAHEFKNFRNGKFKVVERLYKVCKAFHYGVHDGERVDVGWDPDADTLGSFKEDYPDHQLVRQREEFFYLAIVCPSYGSEFLYNDEYHCQPKDPVTGELMWPWVEVIDEELDGDPNGHVADGVGPQKVLNSMMVNKLFQAKHAAGQSHVISPDHFDDETVEDMSENLSDGSRSFKKKKSAPPGPGVELVPQGQASKDGNEAIEFVHGFHDEVMSTPPAMKGLSEGNVAGVLNDQRIQQSFTQNQGSVNNFMHFLTKRAKLWVYYFQRYFTFEMKVRVLEKKEPDDPDFITINQPVQDPYGGLRKLNDINALRYDIVFEDSWQSPSVRDKVRQQILEFRKVGGTQMDPALDAAIMQFFFKLSDAPQDLKDFARQRSMAIQQEMAAKQQMEAEAQGLDQAERIQGMADREAAATVMPPGPGNPQAMMHELQGAAIPA